MSATQDLPDPTTLQGRERYVRTAEAFLGVTLTREQRRVLKALATHNRVHVESGNGVGKSFVAGVANGAFLLRHPDSICMATSGTYSVLNDVLWKPLRRLWNREGLPGRTLESPPRIRIDDEWYFKAVAPRHPGNLEGRHAGEMLVTIEEVDKPDITADYFDSAESMLTGGVDRLLAISNPPDDEGNVAHQLAESDRWHTIRFSSFDSHNVRVDAGEIDGDRIEGLVGLDTIRKDWENWNAEPWPGLDAARAAHEQRDDLDERWYRRRAGVMPPDTAGVFRPYSADLAKRAFVDRRATNYFGGQGGDGRPVGTGIDVARSGDRTVMVTLYRNGDLDVRYTTQGTDYPAQETELTADNRLGGGRSHPVAVDAVGEGSGLADYLDDRLADLHRFGADKKPLTEGTDDDNRFGRVNYRSQRAEALAAVGVALGDGLRYTDTDLREELVAGARSIEFDTRTLDSRGEHGAEVVTVNSKDAVEDRLGRSPDLLDAAMMAVWARDCTPTSDTPMAFQL